jgi:uncharacterized protein (TIGR02444 family)
MGVGQARAASYHRRRRGMQDGGAGLGNARTGTMPHMATDDEAFWQFALRCYARSGVAPLCLHLQDELRADVLLLLYLAWRADRGQAVTSAELDPLLQRSMALRRNLIEPLRAARRALGAAARATASEALQASASALAAAELRSERLQSAWLAGAALPAAATIKRVSAEASIRDYLVHIGIERDMARQQAARLCALMADPGQRDPA